MGLVRASLLAYGLLMGYVAADQYVQGIPNRGTMMSMRSEGVTASIRQLDSGGPPMAVANCAGYQYCELPRSDSPGIYLYLPILGHIFHVQSAELLLKWLFIGLMVPVVALYPLLIFEMGGSVLSALVAPILLLTFFPFLKDTEIYWVMAWAVLLGVPLLSIAWRSARAMMPMLVGVMLLASLASSIRGLAGVPLLVSAIGIVLVREGSWLRRSALVATVLIAYLSISPGLFLAVAALRDQVIAGATVAPPFISTEWHSIYIGLGYLDNPYGIRYSDLIAYQHALAVDPTVRYLGPGYGDVVRGLFFKILIGDPAFVAATILSKIAVVVWTALVQFWPLLFVVPCMVLWAGRRSTMRASLVITLPAVLYGFIPPVLVMPYLTYQMSWLGAWGYAGVLAGSWAIGTLPYVPSAVRRWSNHRGRVELGTRLRARAVPVALLAAVLTPVLAFGWVTVSNEVEKSQQRGFYRQNQTAIAAESKPGTIVTEWNMATAVDSGWHVLPGVAASAADGTLHVTTNLKPLDYQLTGPTVSLAVGQYRVSVEGRVLAGGMDVGVLDATSSSWVVQALYWYGQFEGDSREMSVDFTLDQPGRISVILSNWQRTGARSDWLIGHVSVERLD